MSAPLAYVPRNTALGRASAPAGAVHLLALSGVALVTSHPIVLAGCAAAAVIAGLAAGARTALASAARLSLWLGVLIVAVNAVASQRGATILARGPELPLLGQINVSAEALAEGGVLALRIATVIALFAILSACVNPDRLLRLTRPIARRSALTATLITRLAPLAAEDHARLREGASLRGPAAAPVGRAALFERLVGCSLDRATEIAATLELRGYAKGPPRTTAKRSRAPGDLVFWASGAAVFALAVAARIAGYAGWEAYPTINIDTDPLTVALGLALPLAAALPPALELLRRRGAIAGAPVHA
jgi:energy-coupling factor transport system permease protein